VIAGTAIPAEVYRQFGSDVVVTEHIHRIACAFTAFCRFPSGSPRGTVLCSRQGHGLAVRPARLAGPGELAEPATLGCHQAGSLRYAAS
jgi:hypothetical protein